MDAIVLAHGAGSNRDAPVLRAAETALRNHGLEVLRVNLPFREQRAKGPPHPASAPADRQGLRRHVIALRAAGAVRVYMGGHSYGGRQASILASEEPQLADGLLLLSYPLHPPGKPDRPRTTHFPSLRTAAVFVHGSRDPFGTLEELRSALALIPAPAALIEAEGAGHELRYGRGDWLDRAAGLLLAAAEAPGDRPRLPL